MSSLTHRHDYKGIDFETYSDVDLRKHGMDRYMSSPYFQPLLVATRHGITEQGYVSELLEPQQVASLEAHIHGAGLIGHNVAFEEAVCDRLGFDRRNNPVSIDTAVVARAHGFSSALGRCAPQALGDEKIELGEHLINVFAVPQKDQPGLEFNTNLPVERADEWSEFGNYCFVDASLSGQISDHYQLASVEHDRAAITRRMNQVGWHVDMDLVGRMLNQYENNVDNLLTRFRTHYDPAGTLNFNSSPQLLKWCKVRGIKAKSFDQQHVSKMLKQIQNRVDLGTVPAVKLEGYLQVIEMLKVKQALGGAALSKLSKIIDTVGYDGILRNNYIHWGAQQTGRTTGVGVQMQNLKRLPETPDDVSDVSGWDNDKLAANLRQVFTSRHADGQLIVGDYASIEARGLAYLAGEEWVLDVFKQGKGLYEEAAARHYKVDYDSVTKPQRTFGKVGVLSCGFGAGAGAVRDFAEKMHVELSMIEAQEIVNGFRTTRPKTVELWNEAEEQLRRELMTGDSLPFAQGHARFIRTEAPDSLQEQYGGELWSVALDLFYEGSTSFRMFHGCHFVGDEIRYFKPNDNKTQELWSSHYTDPKTGRRVPHKLYGGKLVGILTQSFCREIFMEGLARLEKFINSVSNAVIIGQFHDEMVVDWFPEGSVGHKNGHSSYQPLKAVIEGMHDAMRVPYIDRLFPLDAEVSFDFRYIK